MRPHLTAWLFLVLIVLLGALGFDGSRRGNFGTALASVTGAAARTGVSANAIIITPYTHSRHARAGYAYDDWNRLTALQRFGYQNSSAPVDELFDNLQHRYNNPALNAPTQVFDYARRSRGHRNTSGDSAPKTRYSKQLRRRHQYRLG